MLIKMAKISKTKIEKKARRKTNPRLRELIIRLKKQNNLEIANLLAIPRRKAVVVNIEKLNKETKPGDKVIVPGKLLGKGEMQHGITIAAYSMSRDARRKLKSCKIVDIQDIINDKDIKIVY